MNLHVSRQQVASKCVAGSVLASILSRVGGAQIRVRFIVWRSHVELAVSPNEVLGEKERAASDRWGRILLRKGSSRKKQQAHQRQHRFHEGSEGSFLSSS